jgi:signal transduction histidine kinase
MAFAKSGFKILGRRISRMKWNFSSFYGGFKDPRLEHDLIAGMDEETKQLRRPLDDLANLQDVLSGSLELDQQPLDVSKWLPVALRPWEVMAREKGLSWSEDVSAGLPLIHADSARLDQALGNLLSNAIKFTPKGGKVLVDVHGSGRSLAIHIIDTGPGIPFEEQERVFMPFYQSNRGAYPGAHGM